MALALPYLENLDYVERYAWFEPNPTEGNSNGTADFYDDSMNLTEIGEFYKNTPSSPSISASYYLGPDNLSNELVVNNFDYLCEPDNSLSNGPDPSVVGKRLTIIPNPGSEKIKVLFSDTIYSIKLYNINGLLIKRELVNGYIDVSDLSKGVYFISVNQHHFKFLKK